MILVDTVLAGAPSSSSRLDALSLTPIYTALGLAQRGPVDEAVTEITVWRRPPGLTTPPNHRVLPCLEDRTLTDIAYSLGIHLETLRNWVRNDKTRARSVGGGSDAGMTSDKAEEFKRLRRENARLKEENEILRKATAFFARETIRRSASASSTNTGTHTG